MIIINSILTIMVLTTILFMTGIIGLFFFFITPDKIVKTILLAQVVSIALAMVKIELFITMGLILFMLSLALIIVYGFIKDEFTNKKKLVVIIPTAIMLLAHLFKMLHLQGAGWLRLGMALSIIVYFIIVLPRTQDYVNELGFLSILAVIAAINLVLHFQLF